MTTVSIWDTLGDPLGQRLEDDLREMARAYEHDAPRTQQRNLGPSEIGKPCTRCLARAVLGCRVTRLYDDPWCRIIGTATHAWLDDAAVASNVSTDHARYYPELRVQPDTDLLPSGGRCDLYDSDTKTVIDHKIVGAAPLKKYRANGPGRQYRTQAHLYGLGYTHAGHRVDHVAVAFWNRGGRLTDLHVWTEPYDPHVAQDALDRYRTIRDLAVSLGVAVLPLLPVDPDCWDCGGEDPTPSIEKDQL
jgi:hypothetical protein